MAGYRVLWASEFVEAAQVVYKANHPDSILDTRDIREVEADDILSAIGMRAGDLDLLDGSPPCASFSVVGKREQAWGKEKQYSETTQRVDDLFFEYARLLRGLQPKVFVAENVPGLVRSKAKGYFKIIFAALKECGYNVRVQAVDGQYLGVPQRRKRLIFIGTRNDLDVAPVFPKPIGRVFLRDVVPHAVRHGDHCEYAAWVRNKRDPRSTLIDSGKNPVGTILQAGTYLGVGWVQAIEGSEKWRIESWDERAQTFDLRRAKTKIRKFTIPELRRVCSYPDTFVLTGRFAQQWERLGRSVPPLMMREIAATVRDEVLARC
jgi:DNA (cytosine-5)-methyltransferase 1